MPLVKNKTKQHILKGVLLGTPQECIPLSSCHVFIMCSAQLATEGLKGVLQMQVSLGKVKLSSGKLSPHQCELLFVQETVTHRK